MSFAPAFKGKVIFAFGAGEIFIHFVEGAEGKFHGFDNAHRVTAPIENEPERADLRKGFAFGFVFPHSGAGGGFASAQYEIAEFIRKSGVITEGFNDVWLAAIRWMRGEKVFPIRFDVCLCHSMNSPPMISFSMTCRSALNLIFTSTRWKHLFSPINTLRA